MSERRRSIDRQQVIAGLFILLGIGLTVWYLPQLGSPEPQTTKLGFGPGNSLVAEFPTALTMVLFGLLYLLTGVLQFVPQTRRAAQVLLWVSTASFFIAVLLPTAAGRQTNVYTLAAETLRLATPLALGALAGIFAERSGVVNIAIEGMMLIGAGFGFAAFVATNNIWLGVVAAMLAGGALSLLHATLSISFRSDQVISGTAMNLLAFGLTGYLRRSFLVDSSGGRVTMPEIALPLLSQIPILGPLIFTGKPIFLAMLIMVPLAHLVFFYTRWGLRTRAVGEKPSAADTVGINVARRRYISVLISGMIAGLAGAWFSLETVGAFDDGMTAGKGFIALAAVIFGKWMPFGAFGGALLFGYTDALATRFQILKVEAFGFPIPTQFLQILPYLVTMVVLAGLIGRAIGPASLGQPYEKRT
jgi:simple sugar transport system permease protein